MSRARASLLALLFAGSAVAASADPPRLFRVTGDDAAGRSIVFYLLGVTHNGLPIEYDDYFDDTVVPVFRAVSHYSYERAVVSIPQLASCPTPLTSERGVAALTALRARLTSLVVRVREAADRKVSRPKAPAFWQAYAERYASQVAEFGLPVEIRLQQAMLASLNGDSQPDATRGRQQVATVLEAMRPEILARSLDAPDDMLQAYCDSGEGRVAYLESALQREASRESGSPSQAQIDGEMEEGQQDFLVTFRAHRPVGVFAASTRFGESFLCERNAKWLDRMAHPEAPGPWFYAVGLSHLYAAAGPTASCAGLLDDLGRLGFAVQPIASTSASST